MISATPARRFTSISDRLASEAGKESGAWRIEHRPLVAPLRVLVVAGTRPEAIKCAPLALAARDRPGLRCTLVATGQHDELFHDALGAFGLAADHLLGACLPDLTIDALAERIAATLPPLLARTDIVIVQGDTTSAWAAARVAHAHGVPVAHVEAGLRSGDPNLPWPEERNRIEIDRIATWLFAPCPAAAANLRAERVGGDILVTGNSGIDALLRVAAELPAPPPRRDGRRRLLVTCHRRESHGAALGGICAAIRTLATRPDVAITVALPGDPGKATRIADLLGGAHAIALAQPLGYRRSVAALRAADLVLSDSGGLQEECAALGSPLLVLRENSERPEVIAAGNALLVGTAPDAIVGTARRLLDDPAALAAMARPSFPYGRGDAAPAMLDRIEAHAAREPARRPGRFASTSRPPSPMAPARRAYGERVDTR